MNDSVAFNGDVNNGTAMRYSENLIQQAANLRAAIDRNDYLSQRYLWKVMGKILF
ncbi:hypothetical protein KHA80_02455 [Anaerobacillus sp. HL2]|nr:hypothetical protein KHA80_02455 [Anaerobacillus sp. HL2]